MKFLKIIKNINKYSGFKQFFKKLCLLCLIFLSLPIISYYFLEISRYKKGTDPLPFFLVDIGSSIIFIAIAFILISKNKLLELKKYPYIKKEGFIFGILSFFGIFIYLFLRYFTSHNSEFTFANRWLFIFLIMFSIFFTFFSLILSIFNLSFVKDFYKNFKKELGISGLLIIIYYIFTIKIKDLWFMLSSTVAYILNFLLNLFFDNVTLIQENNQDPILGVGSFIVRIGKDCSGVESIILYTSLFLVILFLDWQKLNKKKMVFLFLLGLIGVYLTNILRVFLIMIFGIMINPNFAIGLFHSNAGWILFIIYFGLFWFLGYPWAKNSITKK